MQTMCLACETCEIKKIIHNKCIHKDICLNAIEISARDSEMPMIIFDEKEIKEIKKHLSSLRKIMESKYHIEYLNISINEIDDPDAEYFYKYNIDDGVRHKIRLTIKEKGKVK